MLTRAPLRYRPLIDLVAPLALGVLASTFMLWEVARPLRSRRERRRDRYVTNVALGATAGAVVRALVIPAVIWTARAPTAQSAGRATIHWGRVAAALLLLDYTMYHWHRQNHRLPVLWRFHRAHHTDRDLDVTTALRFHPGELLLSIPLRLLQTWLIGELAWVVLLYEAMMQSAALFHHSNVRLPRRLDRALSMLFVTPRLHGIHHSREQEHLDSNWSVVFSLWDRLHGTRRDEVRQRDITVGLGEDDGRTLSARTLLLLPFHALGVSRMGR